MKLFTVVGKLMGTGCATWALTLGMALADEDTTPPTITSITVAPPSVNVTSAAATVTVTIHATDDQSGVNYGFVAFSNGKKPVYANFYSTDRTSGTALDGTYTVTITVPRYVAGTYTLNSLTIQDENYNSRSFYNYNEPSNPQDISHAGVTASFIATSSITDSAPPAITSIVCSPPSVDVSTGTADVTLTITATDDLSGLSDGYVRFSNDGVGTNYAYFYGYSPTTGTAQNGTFTTTVTIPQYAAGTFELSEISIADDAGNSLYFYDTGSSRNSFDISNAGVTASFVATSSPADTSAPVIASIVPSSPSVNVTNGDADVTFTIAASDDLSGVASGYVSFSNGSRSFTAYFDSDSLTSGTAKDGVYSANLTIPRYLAGTYTLSELYIRDQLGRTSEFYDYYSPSSPKHISKAGVTASFTATSDVIDTTAPTITSITASPATVNVSNAPATITLTVAATDALTGLNGMEFRFSNGAKSVDAYGSSDQLKTGDAQSGTYEIEIQVPRYASGTYTLSSLRTYDSAGNQATFEDLGDPSDPGDISHAGVSASFEATSAVTDNTAPAITSITASPASVNVTNASATITLTIVATDALSGLTSGNLDFSNGTTSLYAYFSSYSRISGNAQNGTYVTTVTVPRYAAGTYHLSGLNSYDALGNSVSYGTEDYSDNPADISQAGVSATFAATSNISDTAAPAITSITASPATVDVTTGSATVEITVVATDSLSGLSYGDMYFSNGAKTQEAYFNSDSRISGTAQNGTYSFTVTIPRYAAGTYTLSGFDLSDMLDNYISYGTDDDDIAISEAGVTASFAATSTVTDDTAPVLTAVTAVSPATVDVTGHSVNVRMTLTVTDDLSGFDYGTAYFSNGSISLEGYFDSENRTTGTAMSGTYQATIDVPKGTAGTFTLTKVELNDMAGNLIADTDQTASFVATSVVPPTPPTTSTPPTATAPPTDLVVTGKKSIVTTSPKVKITGSVVASPGSKLKITYLKKGKKVTVSVTIPPSGEWSLVFKAPVGTSKISLVVEDKDGRKSQTKTLKIVRK